MFTSLRGWLKVSEFQTLPGLESQVFNPIAPNLNSSISVVVSVGQIKGLLWAGFFMNASYGINELTHRNW